MSAPTKEQQEDAIIAEFVNQYVNQRNGRFQQIVQILLEDRRDYVVATAALETKPELKKTFARQRLPSLTDVLRRDIFKANPEAE